MPSIRYDLDYLRAGVDSLEAYLLSNDIYWPISGNPPAGEPAFPRLTLSGLLLAQARLKARRLSPAQETDLTDLEERLNALRSRWRVAWENKSTREFHARLNLWRDFLQDYRASPEREADRYGYEVGRRVMLELLSADAAGVPQVERDLLRSLDQLLKSMFVPDGFIWEPDLQPGFPQGTYWYLYGNVKK